MPGSERQDGFESEPDLSSDDMGLDPLYTPEQIQRIEADADNGNNQNPVAVAGADVVAPEAQGVDVVNSEVVPPRKKVRAVMTSNVWGHFIRSEISLDGFYDATCKYCRRVYQMGNSKSTSSLRHHVVKGCKRIPSSKRHKSLPYQRLLLACPVSDGPNPAAWKFDQARSRKGLATMVSVHEYPFNTVSHHYFRAFLKELQPEFKLVTRNTLRSDCTSLFEEERANLYDLIGQLDCRLSFTSDLWTNDGRDRGFMALTGHFIDDQWNLKKRILSFTPLPSPHTGKNISQAIYDKLVLWNLDKKTFCLVLDNASANEVCVKDLLSTHLKDVVPVQGQIFHQRCACHILNLIVQDGLSVLSDEINKIRDTMKFIKNSQARMEKFQLAAAQAKVPDKKPKWDVTTRWNSTYLMLELALMLMPAIERYAAMDKKYILKPSELEWDVIQALVECLKIFYDATMKLSGTKFTTINLYFPEFCEVYLSIKKMESSLYPFIVQMGKQMFEKWDKYWCSGNVLLAISCVLDPRSKMTVVEYYYKMMHSSSELESFMASLKVCMEALFNEYLVKYSQVAVSVKNVGSSSRRASSSASSSVNDTRAGLRDFVAGKKSSEPIMSDLDRYLNDALDQANLDEPFDILAWWKVNAPKYPVLARMARDILAVPISTVASEATFSTSGRTLSTVRNSLNDESIEALICAQDWLRAPVAEAGVEIGDPLWNTDGAATDTICGSN